MEVESVFVTGAVRGIGLEFVRQFARLPHPPRFIFATDKADDSLGDLMEIKKSSKECEVIFIKMDVTKPNDVIVARKVVEKTVGENGLTLLINNAGATQPNPFPEITEESLLMLYKINTVGPIRVLQAALNMGMRTISANVKKDGILIILMCPGWVKTSMGTDLGEITAEESISTILKTLANLNESHNGVFLDMFGNPYPF